MPDDAVSASADLHYLSIADAARLIESRRLSPVELTRAFLNRIDTFDPTERWNRLGSPRRRSRPGIIVVRCTASRSR